jgi:DNA primase
MPLPPPAQLGTVTFAEAIDKVRSAMDIVEVVSKEVALKRRGKELIGLCPFHNERTPSFHVNREKGIYKCFGCGEGGDALAFVMKTQHKAFADVIEDWADTLGLVIARGHGDPAHYQQRKTHEALLLSLNEEASRWFSSHLQGAEGEQARAYLAQRGVTAETLATFKLGLSGDGWDKLTSYLLSAEPQVQADPTLLEQAGLASPRQGQAGGYYDRFRARLMVPILNGKGQVVAFGGRALKPDDEPKYLNSPETVLYNKSNLLFGLPQARASMLAHSRAVIMEGYFDVMAAHQAGVTQAVATCGTALTPAHVALLHRLGLKEVWLCFDSDKAGQAAALKALDVLETHWPEGLWQVKVLTLQGGKDPADFFASFEDAAQGQAAFEAAAHASPDGWRYRLHKVVGETPPDPTTDLPAHLATVAQAVQLVAKVPSAVGRQALATEAAQLLGIAPTAFEQDVATLLAQQSPALTAPTQPYATAPLPFQPRAHASQQPFQRKGATPSIQGSLPQHRQAHPPQAPASLGLPPTAKHALKPKARLAQLEILTLVLLAPSFCTHTPLMGLLGYEASAPRPEGFAAWAADTIGVLCRLVTRYFTVEDDAAPWQLNQLSTLAQLEDWPTAEQHTLTDRLWRLADDALRYSLSADQFPLSPHTPLDELPEPLSRMWQGAWQVLAREEVLSTLRQQNSHLESLERSSHNRQGALHEASPSAQHDVEALHLTIQQNLPPPTHPPLPPSG